MTLVSGIQHDDEVITPIYPSDTIQHYSIIDCTSYSVPYGPMTIFIIGYLYFLVPFFKKSSVL